MRHKNDYKIDVKATINGKLETIDLASDKIDAYNDINREIEYIGIGTYHSYGNQPAEDLKEYHFWRLKK